MNDGRALQLQSLIPHRRSAPLSGSEYYGCLMHVIYHHAPIERTTRYSIEGEGLQHVAVLDTKRVGTPGSLQAPTYIIITHADHYL